MRFDVQTIRQASLRQVARLGFPSPPSHFPLIADAGDNEELRDAESVLRRISVLNVVVARTFGMPRDLALAWLEGNELLAEATTDERALLREVDATDSAMSARVEALWCLMWFIGQAEHLDPTSYCAETLASRLPDLRGEQPFTEWVQSTAVAPRPAADVVAALDLHYCLTWGLAEARMVSQKPPGCVEPYVIWQRRHALEWLTAIASDEPSAWDDVDLST